MALTDDELAKLNPGQLFPIMIEELGETLQAIGKLARFGPQATDAAGRAYDNFYDFMSEFEQVVSTVDMFVQRHGLNLSDELMKHNLKRNS